MDLKLCLVLLLAICSVSEAFFFGGGRRTNGGATCNSDYQCTARKCVERHNFFCGAGSEYLVPINYQLWDGSWKLYFQFQTFLVPFLMEKGLENESAGPGHVPSAQTTRIAGFLNTVRDTRAFLVRQQVHILHFLLLIIIGLMIIIITTMTIMTTTIIMIIMTTMTIMTIMMTTMTDAKQWNAQIIKN